MSAQLKYQGIDEQCTFDIINLNSYNLILGTPWMYQHQICLGFNPSHIIVGIDEALLIAEGTDTRLMVSSMAPEDQAIEDARNKLQPYAEPLCKEVDETDLLPFRIINHTIPLINESKIYPWQLLKCPEAFRAQWAEKRDAYVKSGCWQITSAGNMIPMLLIPKLGTNPPLLQTVVDEQEQNKNTHKLTSPLLDMKGMLRRTAKQQFCMALDLKSTYEQIHIVLEHITQSAVTTPDGNMVSQVLQMGDCNTPATYQAFINHLFSSYIGQFMDMYLDDIIIYSDTLVEHIRHVKIVLDVLSQERLYLSGSKLRFIALALKILGWVTDDHGIQMDSNKVNTVMNWKVLKNCDLLRGFIGSVGYLADNIPNVRIPMGTLSALTGDTVPFRWGYTEQQAFDKVKTLVQQACDHHWVPLDYSEGAALIWMVTDGSAIGILGLVSQGDDRKTAWIAAFYSAKLNLAQQNYAVHEVEMLAGVKTMLRHTDILQGACFKWLTNHKGLVHLLNQKNLSGQQARWLEKISAFVFEIVYLARSENVVADALSHMYANDSPGTMCTMGEFTLHNVVDDNTVPDGGDMPVLAGIEVRVATRHGACVRRVPQAPDADWVATGPRVGHSGAGFVPLSLAEQKEGGSVSSNRNNNNDLLNVGGLNDKGSGGDNNICDGGNNEPSPSNNAQDITGVLQSPDEAQGIAITDQQSTLTTVNDEQIQRPMLVSIVSQSNLELDLLNEIQGQYHLDPAFQTILQRPGDFRNFEVVDDLIYLKEADRKVLCIPKILIKGRSSREIVISEAHSLLAHLGVSKMLDYLCDHVWWKDIIADTKAYCETCHTCKTSKPSNQKLYGLLNLLSVPNYPWESIGMDFVGPLPESGNCDGIYDSIIVVICLLTSMVHLISS